MAYSQDDIRRKIAIFRILNGISPAVRKVALAQVVERRAPYPGQRYRHGWIPINPAADLQPGAEYPAPELDPRPPHLRKYPLRNPGFKGPTYWRVQSADRDPDDLLEPDHVSYSWDNEDVFDHGTSTAETQDDLAAYLAEVGIPIGLGNWVLVEVAGEDLGPGRDRHLKERLVQVDQIVSVRPLDDEFYAKIHSAYDRLLENGTLKPE